MDISISTCGRGMRLKRGTLARGVIENPMSLWDGIASLVAKNLQAPSHTSIYRTMGGLLKSM